MSADRIILQPLWWRALKFSQCVLSRAWARLRGQRGFVFTCREIAAAWREKVEPWGSVSEHTVPRQDEQAWRSFWEAARSFEGLSENDPWKAGWRSFCIQDNLTKARESFRLLPGRTPEEIEKFRNLVNEALFLLTGRR